MKRTPQDISIQWWPRIFGLYAALQIEEKLNFPPSNIDEFTAVVNYIYGEKHHGVTRAILISHLEELVITFMQEHK